ncbi:MAG: sensor histidine kinase [Eubacterium sp.]|nr:sensor histidine kinase [Eubacterium sp.]
MKRTFCIRDKNMSLYQKLRYIILSLALPLVACMVAVLGVFAYYAGQYSKITRNVTISSSFNLDFKENIDLKMYHYSVSSRQQEELPIEDVEEAIGIAQSLKATTSYKESRQALLNVLDYCENLKSRMYMLEQTEDYDSRQLQLENNIYVLTNLIRTKMLDYIYYEAGYLSKIGAEMMRSITAAMLCIGCVMFLVVVAVLQRAFSFSKGITKPVSRLCENVRKIGEGKFQVDAVQASDYEIADLDTGIRRMAERISLLLENVKQEEMLHHKMELQLLQAQINPHFLYNTLDTIVWLVECGMNDEAVKMLGDLSVFFRTMLSKGEDIITLKEEITHTRSYLDIQQVRYRDILDFEIVLPQELWGVRLPKLTLQPLAENALYHGVKEKRGKSKIWILCALEEETAVIQVRDNGIGISGERLKELKKALNSRQRIGFGMSAVQERLRLFYGEPYGMSVRSEYGKGTCVEIRIPVSVKKDNPA